MTQTFQMLIVLLVVISAVAVLARRLEVPPSILLVITGVLLALIPGLPTLQLAPDLVLVLVLPPLVYSSAVAMSWREFRFNLRPIALLAIGCVVFTTIAVAAATHWLLGFPWAVGFVLGAIVSPPDAVAPLSVARRMQIPRRLMIVLEGEGLANDATALVLYRFAVVAVSLGTFSFAQAAGSLVAILVGEIIWGIGVGWLMLRLRRWVRDPKVEIMLSLLTPYAAYWPPEQLGGSGVLATVAAGLYISWNGLRLISAATRLQGVFFWDFLVYLIEGLVFLITGLQIRAASSRPSPPIRFPASAWRPPWSASWSSSRRIWLGLSLSLHFSADSRSPRRRGDLPAVLAVAVCARFHRNSRRRFARGGARDSLHQSGWKPVSGPRPDPVSDLLRDLRDPGRRRPDPAMGHARPWSRPCRTAGAARREKRGVPGAETRARGRDPRARPAYDRTPGAGIGCPPDLASRRADRLKLVDHRNDGDARSQEARRSRRRDRSFC